MGDYIHRVANALLASELLPASLRMKLMRGVGFRISKDCCIWAGASFRSKRVQIGSNVFINVGFFHDGYDQLTIGDNVRIGQHVRILTATHEIGPARQRGTTEVVGRPVTIGDGCWIASGVVILPGVSVAPGCVIAVNSVVKKDTAPNGVYGGDPARRIRELPGQRDGTNTRAASLADP